MVVDRSKTCSPAITSGRSEWNGKSQRVVAGRLVHRGPFTWLVLSGTSGFGVVKVISRMSVHGLQSCWREGFRRTRQGPEETALAGEIFGGIIEVSQKSMDDSTVFAEGFQRLGLQRELEKQPLSCKSIRALVRADLKFVGRGESVLSRSLPVAKFLYLPIRGPLSRIDQAKIMRCHCRRLKRNVHDSRCQDDVQPVAGLIKRFVYFSTTHTRFFLIYMRRLKRGIVVERNGDDSCGRKRTELLKALN